MPNCLFHTRRSIDIAKKEAKKREEEGEEDDEGTKTLRL